MATVTGISLAGHFLPSEEPQSTRPPSIGDLAQDLSSSSAERRSTAIALITERLPLDHPDRNAAIAALVNHLTARIPDDGRTTAEVSHTLTALGTAQVPSDQIDLRYSYLDGIDVSGLEFSDGIPMYGASLKDATLINVLVGSGNWQDMFMERSWLGNCRFRRVLFTGTDLSYVNAPGTEFRDCQFSRAVLTGANFSTSVFVDCDFKGENFVVESARGLPAAWDPDDPPLWPADFLPNILT